MGKKSKDMLEWENKLEKEEEVPVKSKRNLYERKHKLNEAERKLKKKEKELEEMQKNIDAARMNLYTREKEVCALAKKLRDTAKVENDQVLLREYSNKKVFDVKNQESEVKLNERVGSFELKGFKNNITETTRFEKNKGQPGSGEKGYILNEGVEALGIFTRPPIPKTLKSEDFLRHALECWNK